MCLNRLYFVLLSIVFVRESEDTKWYKSCFQNSQSRRLIREISFLLQFIYILATQKSRAFSICYTFLEDDKPNVLNEIWITTKII